MKSEDRRLTPLIEVSESDSQKKPLIIVQLTSTDEASGYRASEKQQLDTKEKQPQQMRSFAAKNIQDHTSNRPTQLAAAEHRWVCDGGSGWRWHERLIRERATNL